MAIALAVAGCVDHETPAHVTTSLRIQITAPQDVGSPTARLSDDTRAISFTVEALDEFGKADTSLAAPVDVYAHTLGTLSNKLVSVDMKGGKGSGSISLPTSYGATFLWIEDASESGGREPTFATGASPKLWFREPLLADVQRSTSLNHSPLEGKQVEISGSQFGAAGKLVVTGVYNGGYTVSDVDCSSGSCVGAPFAHVYAFSSSRPVDAKGRPLQVGHVLKSFSGAVQEFNGYTELNFPTQLIDDGGKANPTPDDSVLPAPVEIQKEWLNTAGGLLNFEQQESALLAVSNVTVCPLDNEYTNFAEWKLDVGLGCGNPIVVITAGQVAGFDPANYVGKKLSRVVGTLKTLNLSFNLFILQPRTIEDLQI